MTEQDYSQLLRDVNPRWMEDGKGLRGFPQTIAPEPAQVAVTQSSVVRPLSATIIGDEAMPFLNPDRPKQQQVAPSKWHPVPVVRGTGSQAKAKVSAGKFYKSFTEEVTVGGLNTEFSVASGDKIWLSITVTNAAPVTATIEHGSNYTGPLVLSGENQTKFNYLIAEIVAVSDPREGTLSGSGNGSVKIVQHLRSSLLATQWAINGKVCMVPEQFAL